MGIRWGPHETFQVMFWRLRGVIRVCRRIHDSKVLMFFIKKEKIRKATEFLCFWRTRRGKLRFLNVEAC